MSTKPRIAIVGLGRTGLSLALALRRANPDLELVGHDKEPRVAQAVQRRNAFDRVEWNLLNTVDGAGLIMLAMPLDGIRDTLKVFERELTAGVVVTDTASTKAPVLEWARSLPEGVNFIGGDPIISPARAEAQAADGADADLFQKAVYCLTPSPTAAGNAIQVMAALVKNIGAEPLFVDAQEHDGLIAGAQHLPYVLAAALLRTATASSGWRDLSKLAGVDFMQATALAGRTPQPQRDILLHHRADLLRWIDVTIETLGEIRGMLAREDTAALDETLNEMIEARNAWLKGHVGAPPEIDATDLRPSLTRMLLGGLAPRGGKKKG